jgi:hypothetical protein
MGIKYPGTPTKVTQNGTAVEVHQLMKAPTILARRVRNIVDFGFIADYLLTGRYQAQGGVILFPDGQEAVFAADDPRAIEPGGEYPLTTMTFGELQAAKTVKWGLDAEVLDESIARQTINPVNTALTRLANSVIERVDSVALAVIASQITETYASAAWLDDAGAIIDGVLGARAAAQEKFVAEGLDHNTVVLRPTQFAKVTASFLKSGYLPRENTANITGGVIPDVLGLNWTTSPNTPLMDPLLVDRDNLGGMAEEDLQSPGYSRATTGTGVGVEVKSIRDDDIDGYRVRARRVTVPIVLDPHAGIRITGTGL